MTRYWMLAAALLAAPLIAAPTAALAQADDAVAPEESGQENSRQADNGHQSVDPFGSWEARYALTRGPLTLGYAEFELAPTDNPGCHVFKYDAEPVGLARLFIGQLHETSRFCVVDGQIQTQRFEFRRDDEPDDNFVLTFDWEAKTVHGPGDKTRQIPDDAMDRLAIQLAVRAMLADNAADLPTDPRDFTMIEDDRIKTYTLQVKGRESVDTPAGTMEAIRVERVRDPRKTTIFWVSPKYGFIPVRVEQRKDDSEVLSIALKDLPGSGSSDNSSRPATGPRR